MSTATLRTLGDELAIAAKDPFLGLNIGASLSRGTYGLLEYCFRTSETVREALSRLIEYSQVPNKICTMQLLERKDETLLTSRLRGEPFGAGRQVTELTLALHVRTLRDVIGQPSWAPIEVTLPYPAPPDLGPYVGVFGSCRMTFDQEHVGLRFASQLLEQHVVSADAALCRVLRHALHREITHGVVGLDFLSALRRAIRENLADSEPQVATIAATLGMSVRSLQRRVHEVGTTFHRVLDDQRRDLAIEYLRDSRKSVKEVAISTGYREVRAFARAFVRWTGESPTAWRERQGAEISPRIG